MRKLVFALTAAAALCAAVPASAQGVYVGVGNGWGGPGVGIGWGPGYYRNYGYNYWDGASGYAYAGAPRARVYVYEDVPRRRVRRNWDDAYVSYAIAVGAAVRLIRRSATTTAAIATTCGGAGRPALPTLVLLSKQARPVLRSLPGLTWQSIPFAIVHLEEDGPPGQARG
jgi:hypothetical protein